MVWINELPAWLLFIVIVGFTLFLSIGGQALLNPFVKKLHQDGEYDKRNDLISFYLAAVGVFYGITLGLVVVGTWKNFADAEEKVNKEAASIAALYRDVSVIPDSQAKQLKKDLKDYNLFVINIAWPLQAEGKVALQGNKEIDTLQHHLYSFKPDNLHEMAIFQEAITQYNRLLELRRLRMNTVGAGLPTYLWAILIFGGVVNIAICWLFYFENKLLQYFLNCSIALFIGIMIFIISLMDNPYRGDFRIGPDAYIDILEQLMTE